MRRVVTHTGKGTQVDDVAGHLAVELVTDSSSGVVQCLRPSVITEAAPALQHAREGCVSTVLGCRVGVEEGSPRFDDPRRLGLLEHELTHQHRPRIVMSDPRKVAGYGGRDTTKHTSKRGVVAIPRRRHRTVAVALERTRVSKPSPCAGSNRLRARPD